LFLADLFELTRALNVFVLFCIVLDCIQVNDKEHGIDL